MIPPVLVYWGQTEEVLQAAELEFRNGRLSGLRAFRAALQELKPLYRTVDTFETLAGDKFVVMARRSNQ